VIKPLARTLPLIAAAIALSAMLGVGAPARAADAQHCMTASDCHGPVPQLCKRCRSGRGGCAHCSCVARKCAIRYCAR
jgi:hypothetical protein